MSRRLTFVAAAAAAAAIIASAGAIASPASGQDRCSQLNSTGTRCNLADAVNPDRPRPGQSTLASSAPPGPTFVWVNTSLPCDASASGGWSTADNLTAATVGLSVAADAGPASDPGTVWIGELIDPASGPTNSGYISCVGEGEALPPQPPPLPTADEIWGAALTFVPEVNLDPYVRGLTGLETHMWYEGITADSVALTLNGYGVSADIEAVEFRWDMDGESRQGLHQYRSPVAGSAEAPAASHTYALPGGVQIVHEVVWAGTSVLTGPGLPPGGVAVDLGQAVLATARDYDVIEVRTPLVTR